MQLNFESNVCTFSIKVPTFAVTVRMTTEYRLDQILEVESQFRNYHSNTNMIIRNEKSKQAILAALVTPNYNQKLDLLKSMK